MTWRGSSVIASSLTLAFPNPTPIAGKAEGSVLYLVPGKTSRHTDMMGDSQCRHPEVHHPDARWTCPEESSAAGRAELSKPSKDFAKIKPGIPFRRFTRIPQVVFIPVPPPRSAGEKSVPSPRS